MKKNNMILISLILLIFAFRGYSAEKMRIAIMDLEPKDISVSDAAKISELIRNEIINTGKYTVIERAQMNQILNEQGLQKTGCTDISCAVEVGRIMNANKMLVGSVMKLGSKIIITGRIVDVEKGVAEFSEKGTAPDQDSLSEAVSDFVTKLSNRIGAGTDRKEAKGDIKKEEKSISDASYGNPYSTPFIGFFSLTGVSALGGYYSDLEYLLRHYNPFDLTLSPSPGRRGMTLTSEQSEY